MTWTMGTRTPSSVNVGDGRAPVEIEGPHDARPHVPDDHQNAETHQHHQAHAVAAATAPAQLLQAPPPPCTPGGGVTDDLLRRSLDDFLRCCSSFSHFNGRASSSSSSSCCNSNSGATGKDTTDKADEGRIRSTLSKATCNLTRLRDKCGTTVGSHIGTGASSSGGMAVVLSPPTAETALRAIHGAFRLLMPMNHSGTTGPTTAAATATTTTIAVVLSFLSQSFACLESDLVFTAMCLPTDPGENDFICGVDPFRILSGIILDAEPSNNGNSSRSSKSNSSSSITEVQCLAISTLSRGMQAVEFVQRYATSVISIPTSYSSSHSALGVGLGLGLDRCRPMVEDVAVHLIDVVVALGEDRTRGSGASNSTTGVAAATNMLPPNPYQRRQAGSLGAAGGGTTATDSDRPVKCDHLSSAAKDSLRVCSISLLSVLFRTDYADWALPLPAPPPSSLSLPCNHWHKQHQRKLENMCKVLLYKAQRIGRDLHDRSATETSAASLSLLVLLNIKRNGTVLDERRMFDANTIDAILSLAFPAAESRVPSRAAKDESLGRVAALLLTDLAFGRGEGYAAFLGNHLSGAVDRAWPIIVRCNREGILDQRVEGLENVLLSTLALHGSNSSRSLVRRSLKSFLGVDGSNPAAADGVLTNDDTPVTHNMQHRNPPDRSLQAPFCDELVTSLLLLARHDCFSVSCLALGVLRSLLEHPPGSSCEDDLGRSLWMSVAKSKAFANESNKFIQNSISLLQYVGSTKFDEGMNDDSMGLYADSKWRGNYPPFVRFMPRLCITLDAMLSLARSVSFVGRLTTFIGDDICESPEDIASSFLFPCKGENSRSNLLRALSFSGATILTRVAMAGLKTSSATDANAIETLVVIKKILRHSMTSQDGTIASVMGDAISQGSSCDLIVRVHRLVQVIGEVIEENEISIAASTYASCRSVVLDAQRARKHASDTMLNMEQMEQRLESIMLERDDLLHIIASVRAVHTKEVARISALVKANTVDERELLLEEKRRAEDQARQYNSRMNQAEDQCQKASALEKEARSNLEQAKAAISELSQRYEELEILAKDEAERKVVAEKKVQELKQDIEEVQRDLNEKSDVLLDLEKDHQSTSDALQVAESSNCELRQGLEDAYSQLVSLAQLFQIKEEDLSKVKTTNRDELCRTRREAEDLASKCAVAEERADAIERENDELKRKVSRLKKELEKERSRKANGPVGYFNKLHDDFEEKESTRRERSERSDRRSGKENSDRESSTTGTRYRSRASSRARDGSDSQRRFYIAR